MQMANSGVSSEVMKHKFNWKSERMTHEYVSISKNALVVSAKAITGGHGSEGASQPPRDTGMVTEVVAQPTPVPSRRRRPSNWSSCRTWSSSRISTSRPKGKFVT